MRIQALRRAVAAGVLLMVLAGCNGRTDSSATGDGAGGASPSVSTSSSFGQAAHGTVTDGQGDSVDVGIALGPARAARDVPEAAACTAAFSSTGAQVAVPVQISETLRAPSPMSVRVDPSDLHGITSGGKVSLPNVQVRWSVKYSDIPQECKGSGMSSPAVTWSSATPAATNVFTAWMILSSGATAADPTGRDTAGMLVFNPIVTVGSYTGVPQLDPTAPQVVQCSAIDPAVGSTTYIGVDPDVAVHYGCTSPTATDHIQQERDAVCNQMYPASQQSESQTSSGTATIFNRTASLFQICEGFGSAGVTFTPQMSCAVVALVADQIPLPVAPQLGGARNLCNNATVINAYTKGTWLKDAAQAGCQFFGSVFADSLGVAAAGATAGAAGPGAVWIGVGTAHALNVGAHLLCDSDLRGFLKNGGAWLESRQEHAVAAAVTHGQCIVHDPKSLVKPYDSTKCPA